MEITPDIYHNLFRYLLLLPFRILLLMVVLSTFSLAQSSNNNTPLPTVKMKRWPGRPAQISNKKEHEKVKDNYKRPRSKSKGEVSKVGDANTHESPSAEETRDRKRPGIFRRLLRINEPSLYQGEYWRHDQQNDRPGTGRITNPRQKKIDFQSQADNIHSYQGSLRGRRSRPGVNRVEIAEGSHRRLPHFIDRLTTLQQKPRASTYPGHLKTPVRQVQTRRERRKAQAMSQSNGPVSYRRLRKKEQQKAHQQTGRQQHQYQGSIKVSTGRQKAGEYSFYQGKIKVRTEKHQSRHYKKLSNEIHQFNGLLRVRKPGKDMHPSVNYLRSVTKNSHEQKEKYRKRRLNWHRWYTGNSQPKHLKEKPRKPRYDKKESEIWYY